jgi:integrase
VARGSGRRTRVAGTFGSVDKHGRGYRARYRGPDGRRHQAPTLFLAQQDARAWLALQQADIVRGLWMPPGADAKPAPRLTLKVYAEHWLSNRKAKGRALKDRTREDYRRLLDRHILPALGSLPIAAITREDVERFYDDLDPSKPTQRAHAYGLLKTILATAVADGKAKTQPCVIRGAGTVKAAHKVKYATVDQLAELTAAMPGRYRAMILLGSWTALRFGEITELRRRDIDLDHNVIRVRRGVTRTTAKGFAVSTPKSDAGIRDVAFPPHLAPAIADHLDCHVGPRQDDLLFPAVGGGHLAQSTFHRHYDRARRAIGRPDLRFHDLRHSGAVLAAQTGATLADLMARLGHSTAAAALRYQHAAHGADARIAAGLSALANGEHHATN